MSSAHRPPSPWREVDLSSYDVGSISSFARTKKDYRAEVKRLLRKLGCADRHQLFESFL